MTRAAWFCPSCQKHHAPHVDTCPVPVSVLSATTVPAPVIHPWPYQTPPGPLADEYLRGISADPCAGCKGACGNVACPKRVTITCTTAAAGSA